jgi:hypothetical protein
MPAVGFEPTISAGERPQTHTLGRTPTGTGFQLLKMTLNKTQIKKTAVGGKAVYFIGHVEAATQVL